MNSGQFCPDVHQLKKVIEMHNANNESLVNFTGILGEAIIRSNYFLIYDIEENLYIVNLDEIDEGGWSTLAEVLLYDMSDDETIQEYLTRSIITEYHSDREDDEYLKAAAMRLRNSKPNLLGLVYQPEIENAPDEPIPLFIGSIH